MPDLVEKRAMGNTGLRVSRLCFGTLPLSPLQRNAAPEQAGEMLLRSLDWGVNFWDTAEIYDNYPAVRWALERTQRRVVIASKTYAYTREQARASIETARRALGRDVIEIMLLHEQESALTLDGHRPALEELAAYREQGVLQAVGVSTHAVEVVRAASSRPEVDVIHPLVNFQGLGLLDGPASDMEAACARARDQGKGIYTMKALGGGHLLDQASYALKYARDLPWADSVAVGMQTPAELEFNARLFAREDPGEDLARQVRSQPRELHIHDWCTGCGRCAERCVQGALYLEDGRARVRPERCALCGYCARVCPEFCLKIH